MSGNCAIVLAYRPGITGMTRIAVVDQSFAGADQRMRLLRDSAALIPIS
jgi:hypothetical protein